MEKETGQVPDGPLGPGAADRAQRQTGECRMSLKKIRCRRTGDLVVGSAEDGSMAFADLSELASEWEEGFLRVPFQAEYAFRSEKGDVFGETWNFKPISFFEEKNACAYRYLSEDGGAEVTVRQTFSEGIMAQTAEIRNLSGSRLCVKQLYNFFNGLDAACLNDRFSERVRLGVIRGEWGGEARLCWVRPEELCLVRATGHRTGCTAELRSNSAYTTRQVSPLLFVRDEQSGRVWFAQHLPDGPYCLEIGLTDEENRPGSCLNLGCGAGRSDKHGFRLYLEPGESYRACTTLLGCAPDFDGAMAALTAWRRAHLLHHPPIPLMFNDYMNCLWGNPDTPSCLSLIEAAERAGAEGYCFDDGWYRDRGVHGFTHLGDWRPSAERFEGKTFRELIAEINARGMIAGVWTELEVCSLMSEAASFPDEYFLRHEGVRIYRCGRLYFDFSHPGVRRYLLERVGELYDLGVRYLKNDYNGHPGCHVDWPNASGLAGAEQHCRAVYDFYAELRRTFPDLRMENCGSGAMRADGRTMENFDVQSISDCEEYDKLPAILNGTLLQLLPEQVGVWAYPYPRIFWEMGREDYLTEAYRKERADGRETAFNLVTGMMGRLYLSGRIDRADGPNFELIRRGLSLARTLREEVAQSRPVFPLGTASWMDRTSFAAQGLRREDTLLLAVWRREGEADEVFLPCGSVQGAAELFPGNSCEIRPEGEGLRVRLPHRNQAVLIRAELK